MSISKTYSRLELVVVQPYRYFGQIDSFVCLKTVSDRDRKARSLIGFKFFKWGDVRMSIEEASQGTGVETQVSGQITLNEALQPEAFQFDLEAMKDLLVDFSRKIIEFVPQLLGALAVLILGYFVAVLVSVSLRWALTKLGLNKIVAKNWPPEEQPLAKGLDLSLIISRAVRYLIMLFVFVAFFESIGLRVITEPLNALLVQIFEYAPRIIGPALLLMAAWIVASFVRIFSKRVLETLQLDKRLGESAGFSKKTSLSATVSSTLYWLVFILFLPAILNGLAMGGLLEPVSGMVDQVLGFIPNIFAAILIMGIGFFAAKIVQKITSNLLETVGVNQLAGRLKIDQALGKYKFSELIGFFLYVVIFIPVLISALNALKLDAVTRPASQMLETVMAAIPMIFGAAILMFIAYLVAKVLGEILSNLASAAGFDKLMAKIGLTDAKTKPSEILNYIIFAAVLLFASVEALRLLEFVALASLMASFLVFSGQLLLGLFIFGVGLFLADLVGRKVLSSVNSHQKLLSVVARTSILVLAGAMALRQMGLAEDIINLAFGLGFGAVAIAAAIAFGLGAKDSAGELVRDWLKAFKK